MLITDVKHREKLLELAKGKPETEQRTLHIAAHYIQKLEVEVALLQDFVNAIEEKRL